MTQVASRLWVASSIAIGCLVRVSSVQAQIVPDNTLPINSTVTPGCTVCTIDGGTVRGANLFHSFSEFSVPTGGETFFNNTTQIQNVLTRVTGNSVSNIDGLIRANGTANLFLLNPNGILFGLNASLNVGGSFIATTANALGLANGDIFSANPGQPLPSQVLNVNPNAFFFNQMAAQSIVNRSKANNSTGLQVPAGQSLLLVGGDVRLEGGQITSPGSRVELGGVAGQGTVGLSGTADDWRLSFPDTVVRADIALSNRAVINVSAGGGGSIAISARNLTLSQGSRLQAGINNGLGFAGAQAGDIQLNATETINLANVNIDNLVLVGGIGNAGGINITTGSLALTGNSFLSSFTQGQGNAGSININTRDTVSLDSGTVVNAVGSTGIGNAGSINITTGSLAFTGNSFLTSITQGQGNAGSININVRDTVSFDSGRVFNTVERTGVGNAGNINITTGSLALTDSAQLVSRTLGQGNAGSVNINARDTVSLDGSAVYNIVGPTSVGNAGNINITTGSLALTDSAQLVSRTLGQGNAGSVNINARDTVSLDSSTVFNTLEPTGVGNAGNINITTGSLALTRSAQLLSQTKGQGNAGSVNINARDTVALDGENADAVPSAILSIVGTGGVGNGGGINIQAQQLILKSNAALVGDVMPTGRGRGGDINLDISGTILLLGGTTVFTGESARITLGVLPDGIGSGGDLRIRAGSLVLQDGGLIKASTQGQGDAGNIDITADVVNISGSVPTSGLPSGLFTSSDTTGKAGYIIINTQTFRIANGAALSARSRGDGQGGDITVNAARTFEALNGGQLITTTFGRGQAGSITVNAGEQIAIAGSEPNYAARLAKFPNPVSLNVANAITETGTASGLFANTEPSSAGRGGDIKIATGQLTVQEGAQLITSTSGSGRAGDITVKAPDIQLSGATSGLFAQTSTSADAGNLTIQPRGNGQSVRVNLQDGAKISASTSSSGNGGQLTITAPESITLTGNGSVIAAETGGSGTGGNLNLQTGTLNIQNQAEVTVSSSGTGSAGSLFVDANQIYLDNQGRIRADTSGGGGDINLRSRDLILRHGSSITTNARGSNITGGNITIDTDNLLAVPKENSDISANAEDSFGGRVIVNASGIFGTQFRERPTPLSDITASSQLGPQFNGTVELNTPGIDPNRGLINLPTAPVDTQVSQVCQAGARQNQNSFIITGRGGLPPNPRQVLRSQAVQVDWVTLDAGANNPTGDVQSRGTQRRVSGEPAPQIDDNVNNKATKIVEAQGWVVDANGKITLVATASAATPHSSWHPPTDCGTVEPAK